MKLMLTKMTVISALVTGSLVVPATVESQSSQYLTVNKQVTTLLEQEVQTFLEPWPEAHYKVAIRKGHKMTTPCKVPDNLSRTATSRPPIGAIRVNMDCADGRRGYRVVDVTVNIPVVVSRGSLARNQTLTLSDLKLIDVPWEKLRGQFYTDVSAVLGRTVSRSIKTGKVLESNHLAPQYLIKKGEGVTIQASKSGLKVSMIGTALESGEFRHRIQVRNRSSGKVIDAWVTAKGKVEAVFQ